MAKEKSVRDVKYMWFKAIEDKDHALKVLKDCRNAFYFLAGLNIVIFGLMRQDITEGVLLAVLATILYFKKSRVSAVALCLLGIATLISTIANRFIPNPQGGNNVLLAIIFIAVAARATQTIFAYHRILKTKILRKNVIVMNVIAIICSIIGTVIAFIIFAIIAPDASDEAIGRVVIYTPSIIYLITFMRILPFTKSKPSAIGEEDIYQQHEKNEGREAI